MKAKAKAKATPRTAAARKRCEVAILHLDRAASDLLAACSDLSSVMGANNSYSAIHTLTRRVLNERRALESYVNDPGEMQLELDHDPSAQELIRGHGPNHGCGNGRKKR